MKHNELLKLSTEQLVTMVEDLDKTFTGKEKELQAAKKENLELTQKVTDLTKDLDKVQKELQSTVEFNDELSKKVEQLPKVEKRNEPSFSVDGVDYGFVYPKTVLGNRNISAEDVVNDKDLQSQLIKQGSGMLKTL